MAEPQIILDPTDERVPVRRELTPRPESVSGTIALLDISKPRGDVFLDRMQELIQERPTVGFMTRSVSTPGSRS